MFRKNLIRSLAYVISLLLLIVAGCESGKKDTPGAYSHIDSEDIKTILKGAIDAAGGIEKWRKIRKLNYTKQTKLYFEDGSLESELTQRHRYVMRPQFSATIAWEKNGNDHQIQLDSLGTRKLVNGDRDAAADEASLYESVMSAYYTLGMPFKLLDPGTTLTYEGRDTLREGKIADVIKAAYQPEVFDNHSTSDLWWYYFDSDHGTFLGSMVYHTPTYAYIENREFNDNLPLKFYKHRKSYRVDSLRNIQYLRAEFWYSDFEITGVKN